MRIWRPGLWPCALFISIGCANSPATCWAASGALDYWLAAEQHLRLLAESAVRTAGARLGREEVLARTLETFSPADYLEQIRKTAYQLWETAENQHQSALEFWLAAENRLMDSLAAGGTATASQNPRSPG